MSGGDPFHRPGDTVTTDRAMDHDRLLVRSGPEQANEIDRIEVWQALGNLGWPGKGRHHGRCGDSPQERFTLHDWTSTMH
jgi:hypothetical protein